MDPRLALYLILPAICAFLFHFFVGRGYGQMVLYLLVAILGFWGLATLASILRIDWVPVMGVPVIPGLLGTLVALLLARRLLL